MIHCPSRCRLALAVRRYVAARGTNDQLDEVDVDWRDRGAVAVKQMTWFLYDDLYTHKAVGPHALTKVQRRIVARWIVFLMSQEEYLWPDYNFIGVFPTIASVLTLGWWGRVKARRWKEFTEAGDFEAWPFISNDAERAARSKPLLLARGADRAMVE